MCARAGKGAGQGGTEGRMGSATVCWAAALSCGSLAVLQWSGRALSERRMVPCPLRAATRTAVPHPLHLLPRLSPCLQVLERCNTVSGKVYRDDPAIMVRGCSFFCLLECKKVLAGPSFRVCAALWGAQCHHRNGWASASLRTGSGSLVISATLALQAFNLINEPRCSGYEVGW